jgi:phosphohistidine phosphatase SixA
MTRRLLLVRHARAAPSAGADLLRPLTEDGELQAREQGRRLRPLALRGPVLCSPAARCVQTAHGLLEGLGRQDELPEVRSDLSETSAASRALEIAMAAGPDSILVGHQPGLTDLACALLHRSSLTFALPPATAVLLHGEGAAPWSVAQVLSPP